MKTIETERLLLTPWTTDEADVEGLYAYAKIRMSDRTQAGVLMQAWKNQRRLSRLYFFRMRFGQSVKRKAAKSWEALDWNPIGAGKM